MTPEERAAELTWLLHAKGNQLQAQGFTTFSAVHKRIEELIERPVWTHEMADADSLVAELTTGQVATMDEIIGKIHKLRPDLPVIVVAELEDSP